MGDISSGISPIGGSGVPRAQNASLSTSQSLRGDGSVQEATTGQTSGNVTQNSRVSSSQSSISITDQRTQPQSPVDFGMLLLLSALLSDDEEKNKSNPFMLLVGFALLSALQQQSQSQSQAGQFLQFESQSLEISQSVTTTQSSASQSATYQQSNGAESGGAGPGVGGEIDVTG